MANKRITLYLRMETESVNRIDVDFTKEYTLDPARAKTWGWGVEERELDARKFFGQDLFLKIFGQEGGGGN